MKKHVERQEPQATKLKKINKNLVRFSLFKPINTRNTDKQGKRNTDRQD